MFLLFRVPGTNSDSREGCLVRFMSVNLVKKTREQNRTEKGTFSSIHFTLSGEILQSLKALNQRHLFITTHMLKVTGSKYISRKV